MVIQKIAKNNRRVKWHANCWGVVVFDGNGEEWLTYFPQSGIASWHGDMTPELARVVLAQLQATIDHSPIAELARKREPAVMIPLHRDPPEES